MRRRRRGSRRSPFRARAARGAPLRSARLRVARSRPGRGARRRRSLSRGVRAPSGEGARAPRWRRSAFRSARTGGRARRCTVRARSCRPCRAGPSASLACSRCPSEPPPSCGRSDASRSALLFRAGPGEGRDERAGGDAQSRVRGCPRRPRRRRTSSAPPRLQSLRSRAMKVLLVTMYFPPAGGGGVQRPLKLATHLPALGIETHVLAPDDPKWIHRDEQLPMPTLAWVHRTRFVGPRGRRPAEELHGTEGLGRYSRQVQLFGRRLLVPDEGVPWNLTAIPAAIRLVRQEGIDVVITTSPPGSVHLVGAAVKRATRARWVADLRDSLVAHPHRDSQRFLVRAKEQGQHAVARLVTSQADGIVTVSDAIAAEMRTRNPRARVVTIANGSDFDDFDGLEYHSGSARFRITHTASFFGKRDPRPFLTALARVDSVVARFVGDFRSSDREWSEKILDRMELIPYAPHRLALELQRDSEALLLLIPDAAGRGRGVLSGKLFEYLAAGRPILAVVPPDGAAAALVRDTGAGIVVAPDDVDGIERELTAMRDRWRAGRLEPVALADEWRTKVSRRARVQELADLLHQVT